MSVAATVVAPASPEEAWGRWSDLGRWPSWNPYCLEATLDGPLEPGSRIDFRLRHPRGRDFYTRPRITAVEPPRRLIWAARSLGLSATTDSLLQPEPDGTRVTIVAASAGRMAFAYRMTFSESAQAAMYTGMLDALAQSFRD